MEVIPDRQTNHLTVTLSPSDIDTILNGGSVESNETTPKVTVSPLSEINPDSRRIQPADKPRVRKRLGALTSQATILRERVVIHVPEPFLDEAKNIRSEQIPAQEIIGRQDIAVVHSIRVVLEHDDSDVE